MEEVNRIEKADLKVDRLNFIRDVLNIDDSLLFTENKNIFIQCKEILKE